MLRYLRLYAYFVRFSFSRAMEFRVDFFFRILMDAIWYAVHLGFFAVIYLHTPLLGGWNFDQILVFMGGLFVVDGLQMSIFSNNNWWFPIFVNRGELDYYLVRPVSPLFFLTLRDFAANSFVNLLMAIGVFVWALLRYPPGVSLGGAAMLSGLLLCGLLVHEAVGMIFLIPVFWLQNAGGLREVSYALFELSARPHRIFSGWTRRLLLTFLPLALIASFPVQAFFDGFPASAVLHILAVTAALYLFLAWFWRRGLRAYSSASS